MVEVKDLAGVVDVGEHEFTVNGEFRRHPVAATRLKAQKIKSRFPSTRSWAMSGFSQSSFGGGGHLDVVPSMRKFVMNPMQAAAAIGDPTAIGLNVTACLRPCGSGSPSGLLSTLEVDHHASGLALGSWSNCSMKMPAVRSGLPVKTFSGLKPFLSW